MKATLLRFSTALALLAGLFSPLASASAQHFPGPPTTQAATINLRAGTTHIGMVNGNAAYTTQRPDGVCISVWIVQGPLKARLLILGSEGSETIIFDAAPTEFCGRTFSPLVTNGFLVTVGGQGGGNTLINSVVPDLSFHGGAGDDLLANFASADGRTAVWGEQGNDLFFGDSWDWMLGQGGNDTFCVNGGAILVDGGDDYDHLCGGAFSLQNVEDTNCPCF